MKVDTTISGSHCVVEVKPGVNGVYIDARRGFGIDFFGRSEPNDFTWIELVVAGHVRYRETIANHAAPERIVQLMKGLQ